MLGTNGCSSRAKEEGGGMDSKHFNTSKNLIYYFSIFLLGETIPNPIRHRNEGEVCTSRIKGACAHLDACISTRCAEMATCASATCNTRAIVARLVKMLIYQSDVFP